MECVELKVVRMRGSTLTILECGPAMLSDGHTLIVKAQVGNRMLSQYKPHLVKVQELDREGLSGGFYEISKNVDAAEASEDKGLDKPAEDKSMKGKKGKRKKGGNK